MPEVQIAGERWSADKAHDMLAAYAVAQHETVKWYDLGGDGAITASDRIGLADIGRAAVIAARFKAEDVPAILSAERALAWEAVPHEARMEDADPESDDGLYKAADQMFRKLTLISGVKAAKATKLLHLKRPWLFPIFDREVCRTYGVNVFNMTPDNRPIWSAFRHDLVTNRKTLTDLQQRLAASSDSRVRLLALVPELRLQDMMAWEIGRSISLVKRARMAARVKAGDITGKAPFEMSRN